MLQDLRFALRLIAKDRWFASVAVLALSLGIGMNAMVFTLVNAVLIRGLPFPESGNLYMLGWESADGGGTGVAHPELQDWRTQSRAFEGLAAFWNTGFNISDGHALPEQARGARLTANAFSVLRQQPLIGRDFTPDDERSGAEPVVILGYNIWKNRYNEDRAVLGRTLRVNGTAATIIGVMPPNMQFPTQAAMWMPVVPTAAQQSQRTSRFLNVFGRVKPDVSRSEAVTEMNGIAGRLVASYPEAHKELKRVAVQTFNERFNGGQIRIVFLSMMGAVGFVLLIACANVANLQLSRSATRSREIAVRIALGATRWRIVRQLLVESVLLGFMGGVLGLGLTLIGVRLFDAAVAEAGKPYWIVFTVDYVVLGYLAAICVVTGVLFGLAPALHVTKTSLNEVMKEGGRGTAGGRGARWTSGILIVGEVALTIVLLVGAGLMVRSFLKLYAIDIGMKPDNLMAMRLNLSGPKYDKPEVRREFYTNIEARLAAVPGIDASAVSSSVPPFGGTWRRQFEIDGRPARNPGEQALETSSVTINPAFFEVAGVQMRRGRAFNALDGNPGVETAIINERMAARFFPNEDPIGRRIKFIRPDPPAGTPAPSPPLPPEMWRTIVGVVPTLRHNSPQDAEPDAVAYLPLQQHPDRFMMLFVRSRLEPGTIMNAVRREVQAIDQDQPVFTVQTVEQMLTQATWPYRVFGSLFAIFAVFGLVLSSVGLYAVMAYSVTQRTAEVGVRMALGAEGPQVSWMFLKRGLIQLALGLSIGLAAAFGVSRVMRTLLVQVTPTDPLTFVAITVLLSVTAIAACLIPARRATRIDPLIALRT
jgi:predicted permease